MEHQTADTLQYTSIRCNPQNLTEWEHGRPVFIVPLAQIKHITLRHGILAPHPILLSITGAILTALGIIPLIHFLYVTAHGGRFFILEASMTTLLFIGLWAFFTAFRRGYYLDVATDHGRRRLRFHPHPSPELMREFVSTISNRFQLRSEVHI